MPTEDRDYHIDRARIEFDRAYRSDSSAAARPHGLATLHMKRVSDASAHPAEPARETLAETLGAAI